MQGGLRGESTTSGRRHRQLSLSRPGAPDSRWEWCARRIVCRRRGGSERITAMNISTLFKHQPSAAIQTNTSAPPTEQDHFTAIRSQIEQFDEEKKGALERLMVFLFNIAAYVGPFIVALAVAQEIADTYSGAFAWGNSWSVGTHIVAWFGELVLAALTVSIATAVRRVVADEDMLPRLVASIAAFVVFSVASGLAQWYVATLHVSPTTASGQAALIFRVAMPVAIDLASMLYLSIMKVKS